MKILFSPFASFVLVATLTACSSSNGSTELSATAIPTAEINSLLLREESAVEVRDAADLPSAATMSGVIGISFESQTEEEEETIFGRMNVNADFNSKKMTGSATNLGIYDVTQGRGDSNIEEVRLVQSLDGTLELDATISGTTFSGGIEGTAAGDYEDEGQIGTFIADVDLDVSHGEFYKDTDGLLLATADLDGDATVAVTLDDESFSENFVVGGGLVVGE